MSFRKGFFDRKEWIELARSLDYTFEDVQKIYTKIALNVYSSDFVDKVTYTLGRMAYWFLHEPMFLEDIEVRQLERDKKRWNKEGKTLVDLSFL
jgi:hypothetical protein